MFAVDDFCAVRPPGRRFVVVVVVGGGFFFLAVLWWANNRVVVVRRRKLLSRYGSIDCDDRVMKVNGSDNNGCQPVTKRKWLLLLVVGKHDGESAIRRRSKKRIQQVVDIEWRPSLIASAIVGYFGQQEVVVLRNLFVWFKLYYKTFIIVHLWQGFLWWNCFCMCTTDDDDAWSRKIEEMNGATLLSTY